MRAPASPVPTGKHDEPPPRARVDYQLSNRLLARGDLAVAPLRGSKEVPPLLQASLEDETDEGLSNPDGSTRLAQKIADLLRPHAGVTYAG